VLPRRLDDGRITLVVELTFVVVVVVVVLMLLLLLADVAPAPPGWGSCG
jgi:hypothetical protein